MASKAKKTRAAWRRSGGGLDPWAPSRRRLYMAIYVGGDRDAQAVERLLRRARKTITSLDWDTSWDETEDDV